MKPPLPLWPNEDDPLARSPLMDTAGRARLARIVQHADAPRFNYATGDRLRAEDLPLMDEYRAALRTRRGARTPSPSPEIVAWVEERRERVPWFIEKIPAGMSLERDWTTIPTSNRRDLATEPWRFVPYEEPLDRLVVYRTAGTTGHPISVPHHPVAIRFYEPLIEEALARHGAAAKFSPGDMACMLVGAQIRTYTYATLLYNWSGAGFAKVNLRPTEWNEAGSAARYFAALAPRFLTGDPIAFAEMLRQEIPAQPLALITTSVALASRLRERLRERFRAPVIDWYSLVETGPIGYACPAGRGYHLLPPDIHAEVLRADGTPVAPGERGEIAVTGGRNVFFPLLRYRTGDYGRMDFSPCPCGDPMPRFLDLEGREPLLFRAADGTPVSTVDLSRLLREFPLLLHEFAQKRDLGCELVVRPLPDAAVDEAALRETLVQVLGDLPLELKIDPHLGDRTEGKALPFRSELMVEE